MIMSFLKSVYSYILSIFIELDHLLQIIIAPFVNPLLSKSSYKFGTIGETVSSVLGKNIRMNKCRLCKGICYILSKLFHEKHHCIKSIKENP